MRDPEAEAPDAIDVAIDAAALAAGNAVLATLRALALIGERRAETREETREAPALMSRAELARALHVSIATIDRIARGGAPVVRVGGRRRFALSDVRAWLASRPAQRSAPTRGEADPIDVRTIARSAGLRVCGGRS